MCVKCIKCVKFKVSYGVAVPWDRVGRWVARPALAAGDGLPAPHRGLRDDVAPGGAQSRGRLTGGGIIGPPKTCSIFETFLGIIKMGMGK